jgi:glycosyltransferase involved in cell wall biosynthesis
VKVLFIGPLPEPMTGQSLACQVLYEALKKTHTVELINLSKSGLSQGLSSFGRVIEVASIIWRAWRRCRYADVVYFTVSESRAGNAKDLLLLLVCGKHLRRMVLHLHGGAGMREIMRRARPVSRWLNSLFLGRVGAVIVLGESLKDIYSDFVPPDRLRVIPNFAEDVLFADEDEVHAKFERQRPLKVLFLSNLLPGKGHLELASAYFGLDMEDQQAIQIDFAGSFENTADRDAFLAAIRDYPHLRYCGPVRGDAKVTLLKRAHLFCLPTYYAYEGQPISILEAYAAGCAVITTPHSGIPDIFKQDINGIFVQPRSSEAVRSALLSALNNATAVRDWGVRNRQEAGNYRRCRHVVRLEATLSELVMDDSEVRANSR